MEIGHSLMRGALNLVQITLACGLGLDARNPDFRWRPRHPKLCDWFDRLAARPSFAATAPPSASSTRAAAPNKASQGTRKKPRTSERKR
jgi:glutathione S-transferase